MSLGVYLLEGIQLFICVTCYTLRLLYRIILYFFIGKEKRQKRFDAKYLIAK